MAWATDLPDELVEHIIVLAWISDRLHEDRRWPLYSCVSSLCRRWRSIMLAVRQSNMYVETSNDIIWNYCILTSPNLALDSMDISARPLPRSRYIRISLKYLAFAATFASDCSILDINVGLAGNAPRCLNISEIRNLPQFPSLSHVGLTWPRCQLRRLLPQHPNALVIPIVASVRSLSLYYPAENDLREFVHCVPILSKTFPNVTMLRLRGPVPLTHVLSGTFFPKLTEIILDDPPLNTASLNFADSSNAGPDGDRGPGIVVSYQALSQTMLWVITAAVKSRGKSLLERILLLGHMQSPSGWVRMTQACLQYGVALEYKAASLGR